MRKLWGGAFSETTHTLVDRFGQSIDSDLTFWEEDVVGSIAHARMLGATGILTQEESATLIRGLEQIRSEGPDALSKEAEDIHAAIEFRLGEIVGEVAGKLHTARSRNDQVATDTRLWLRNQLDGMAERVKALQSELVNLASRHASDVMPGYTHQQRAQPITLGYHFMAHFWALQRHGRRLEVLREFVNLSPLGSAALAGSGFPIDREMTAKELGFAAPVPNALDATSDRSYLMDALHVGALIMVDLSRISQELVLWSGREFGFVRLNDSVTTGSSIMPQKRNPDMAELIRGRSARAIAHWVQMATVMKALPLGYNRDTQEDKPPLFDTVALVVDSLELVRLMLHSAEWQLERMASSVRGDFSTATDLADFLASQGMPFRHAHEIVGKVVRGCDDRKIALEDLDVQILGEIAPEVPREALDVLSADGSVRRRESIGGPGPKALETQINRAKELVAVEGFPTLV